MQQIYGVKVSVLTRGGLTDMLWICKGKNSNPCSDVCLNSQKSAEVIVPLLLSCDSKTQGEGLNDKRFSKFEGHGEIL